MFVGAGNLGRDPDMRQSQSGTEICNLSVACEAGWGDKKHTEWARVVCFGKTAEFCGKYLSKGDSVLVVGRMQTNKWTDQSGNERYTTEILADRVQSLRQGGGQGGDASRQDTQSSSSGSSGGSYADDIDDEIPFAPETRV